LNSIKLLGVVLLCLASLALLLAIVLPTVALLLGLGIDVPPFLPRSGYSHPWLLLVGGLGLLVGWAAWRVVRSLTQHHEHSRRNG
jgi:hypothetical protein